MCLIFVVINQHPDFPVIIAANRDEYYDRPSASAHYWPETPYLLAGRDELAGGTWLGVTRQGRFAAVTNYREPGAQRHASSRGHLVSGFLQNQQDPADYTEWLERHGSDFAGFNCLYGFLAEPARLYYFSNRCQQQQTLATGIHGLSNALLDSDWPKISRGKAAIHELLQRPFVTEEWLAMLQDEQAAADADLPDTGIGLEKERLLSPRFIRSDHYGTRSSTIITVSRQQQLTLAEFTHHSPGRQQARLHTFGIES